MQKTKTMNESFTELAKFFWLAFAVVACSGAALAVAGIYLHQRRGLFLGAALPQIAGFGLVLMSLSGAGEALSVLVVLAFCTAFLAWKPDQNHSGVTLEAFIGTGFVVAMAGSLLALSLTHAEAHGQELLFKGSILAASPDDLMMTMFLSLPLALLLIALRRRFLLVNLIPLQAQISGIKVRTYELFQFFLLSAIIVINLKTLGAMATFGFLLFPCLSAISLTTCVSGIFWLAPTIAFAAGLAGIALAIVFDLPAGPSLIFLLALSWLLARNFSRFVIRR